MRAAGALPTEERVQRMSELQWLYCYYNLKQDEEDEELKWKARLDYLGLYIAPDVARSVIEADIQKEKQARNGNVSTSRTSVQKKEVQSYVSDDGNTQYVTLDTDVNASFEDEFRRALAEEGMGDEEFTELPDSQNAGNPYESQEDFLSRVFANQNLAMPSMDNVEVPIGFETREEYEEHLESEKEDSTIRIDSPTREEDIYAKYGIDPDDIDIIEVPE